jgi:acyl-CoA thioester hydrolase
VRSFALRASALQCAFVLQYPHRLAIQTRWKDNDVYGHVNNAEYYSYFDSAINAWLIREGGLDIERGEVIGLCVESHCEFHAALAFPDTIEVGLRVGKLGNSSVRYELAIFRAGENEVTAEGHFVHVFVERETRRPTPIPDRLRGALERLMAPDEVPSP